VAGRVALLVVDVQKAFDDAGFWGPRNNPDCERNVGALIGGAPDLLVTKHVNSAFHGDPDLAHWLREGGVDAILVCGIQTNMCCETTARVGANLGFDMRFALDATHTFDLRDRDGATIPADELARVTAANLDPEFGRVLTTAEAVAELRA
jgi:nicotinamidase-related amidase